MRPLAFLEISVRLLVGALILGAPAVSMAAITINAVRGASVVEFPTNTGTDNNNTTVIKPEIFGGMAGPSCSNGNDVCNNCGDAFDACNTRRIYPTLNLQIEFTSNAAGQAGPAIAREEADSVTRLETTGSSTSVGANQSAVVVVPWADICRTFSTNGDASCETSFTGNLFVGIDADNDGKLNTQGDDSIDLRIQVFKPSNEGTIATCTGEDEGVCGFTAYPGDSKVFIEDIDASGGFPNSEGIQIKAIRVMYSNVSFDDIKPASVIESGTFEDLDVGAAEEGNPYTESSTVSGLTNNVTYFFKVGTIDQANNFANFIDDTVITDTCTAGTDSSIEADVACPYIATPQEVLGLLTEDLNCFVATAAYGSSMSQELKTLREFRNKILLPTAWGRSFVRLYYKFGPFAARKLVKSDSLRTISRGLLWPVIAWAKLALKWGLMAAISLIAIPLVLALLLLRFYIQKRHPLGEAGEIS